MLLLLGRFLVKIKITNVILSGVLNTQAGYVILWQISQKTLKDCKFPWVGANFPPLAVYPRLKPMSDSDEKNQTQVIGTMRCALVSHPFPLIGEKMRGTKGRSRLCVER